MRNNNKGKTDDDYPYPQLDPHNTFHARIVGTIIVGTLVIWFLCSKLPDPKDFWTVFIGGSISYLILVMMVAQKHVSEMQWVAMQEQLQHAKDAFDMVERPIVIIKEIVLTNFPNLKTEIVIQNKGRTGAKYIVLSCGIIHIGMGEHPPSIYPGSESESPFMRMFLANEGKESIPYTSDNIWVADGDDGEWKTALIYGHGRYQGMRGQPYNILPFAFRIVFSKGGACEVIRDDGLAYEWAKQKKGFDKKNPN